MNDERATYPMTNEERDLIRCPACGVPWTEHDPICSRHDYFPFRAFLTSTDLDRMAEVRDYRDELASRGWIVRSRWLDHGIADSLPSRRRLAQDALEDIRGCNVLILFDWPVAGRYDPSAYTSLGVALGRGIRVLTVGPPPPLLYGDLPEVQHFPDWGTFLVKFWPAPMATGVGR